MRTPVRGVPQKVLHKYLTLRDDRYYFRWRIPADLRAVFDATELVQSLYTRDLLQAIVRARPLFDVLADIKNLRYAFKARQINHDEYLAKLREFWQKTRRRTLDEESLAAGGLSANSTPKADAQSPSMSQLSFKTLFEEFLVYKADTLISKREGRKPIPLKVQKEYRRYFNTLSEILPETNVLLFDRRVIKDALLTYKQLPQRNKAPYKGLPVAELLEMDIPEDDHLANKTVEAVRKLLQGLFRFAIDSGYMDTSPARDLNLKLDVSTTFAPITKKEVQRMLIAAGEEKVQWQRWLPLLAAYTGARRAELVQLRKQDIKFDTDSNRHYILITDAAGSVKTENAVRQVPMHPRLIESGFLEFVESCGDRLFNDLKPQSVTAWFARFRQRLGIEPFDDYGNKKVFHSFRHTFITFSRAGGNSLESVQQVVGHEKTTAGITDRYSHRMPLGDVLNVVDRIAYED